MKAESKKAGKKAVKSKLDSVHELKKMGERIKQLRVKMGYTSYEYFAYDHNISRAQFGRYEKGQDLRLSSLIKVINAFGITLPEFFSEGFD
jgi:transcriptional regulator with XRE-family HTH domain